VSVNSKKFCPRSEGKGSEVGTWERGSALGWGRNGGDVLNARGKTCARLNFFSVILLDV